MNLLLRTLYRTYQILFVVPIGLLATFLTAIVTTVGCTLGSDRVWAYYPPRIWGWLLVRLFLLPVRVEGREHLQPGQSYVFCPNHQGAFDIFLVYGFLRRNFKWAMKKSLRHIPFVGRACEAAGQVFIDKSGPSKIKESMQQARQTLSGGVSMVIFPEGQRTATGAMTPYKRGAFLLADELQLPVVPITINGTFSAMPRQRDGKFVAWSPLSLTIHQPIPPKGQGPENVRHLAEASYNATKSALKE